MRREQAGYEQQIQAVDEAMKAIQEQIDSVACTMSKNKVGVWGWSQSCAMCNSACKAPTYSGVLHSAEVELPAASTQSRR